MYEAENNIEFEKFLFDHKDISKFKYKKNLIKNHNTRELFLLSLNDLNNILDIINNNIKDYKKISKDEYIKLKEIELENNKIKLENNKIKLQVLKIQNNDDTKSEITELSESEDIEIEELNEFKPKLEYEYTEGDTLYDIRKINNSRSPYIQKYDPNKLNEIWVAKIGKRDERHKELMTSALNDFYDVNSEISDKYNVMKDHIKRLKTSLTKYGKR